MMERAPRFIVPAAIVSLLASAPARAVPAVTQVIDGAPQIIAPQQLIVSCDPLLPILCANALAGVGAIVTEVGQDAFSLAVIPSGTPLQDVLDTLRAALGILSAEHNRI